MIDVTDRVFVVGDIDKTLHIETGLDLSAFAAADLTFRFLRPDGTVIFMANTRTIVDATTGQVTVKTSSGDLNQEGEYIGQVLVSGGPTSDMFAIWVESQLT